MKITRGIDLDIRQMKMTDVLAKYSDETTDEISYDIISKGWIWLDLLISSI